MPLHRDEQAVVVEDLGPEVQGQLPHLLGQLLHRGIRRSQGSLLALGLGGGNLEGEAGEDLADLVVQLECETAALLLLHDQ